MNVYFISGVAADEMIFKHIRLPDNYEPVYLKWIKPLKGESLEHYALRMIAPVDVENPFMLIGLSFGGMLATEIAKKHRPEQLVLISSIPSSRELPGYYRIAGRLKLQYLVPVILLKSASLLKRFFTNETPEEKSYLRKVIRQSESGFIKWCLNAILGWKSAEVPPVYIHIHGSADEILPVRFVKPTHIIKGGSHLMILTKAKEINQILAETIGKGTFNPHRQNT